MASRAIGFGSRFGSRTRVPLLNGVAVGTNAKGSEVTVGAKVAVICGAIVVAVIAGAGISVCRIGGLVNARKMIDSKTKGIKTLVGITLLKGDKMGLGWIIRLPDQGLDVLV